MIYNSNHHHDQRSSATIIVLDVVFGSPQKACAGQGICRMNRLTYPPVQQECTASRTTIKWYPEGMLSLHCVGHQFPSQQIMSVAGESVFQIEQGFDLPRWFCKRANTPSPAHILAGYYPLQETAQGDILIQLRWETAEQGDRSVREPGRLKLHKMEKMPA